MTSAFVFMLVILEPSGIIFKPEAFPTAAACAARMQLEQAKPPRPHGYAICVPDGAAVEMQAAATGAGS